MNLESMPRPKKDLSVREKLLQGAIELFNRKGYAATTVREIVTSAGVSKPVLYYYFGSKEGIYLELMRLTFAKLEPLLASLLTAKGKATDRLLHFCDRAFSLFLENIKVVRIMYSIYYGPPQGAPFFDFDSYHLKIQEALRRLVVEGIRQGEFRRGNSMDMTWVILGAINVAMELELGHPKFSLGKKGLKRLLLLIFQGLFPSKRKGKENE